MKQELPIAVGLLAIGGLLWLSGSWTSNPEAQVTQTQQTASTTELQSSFVQQATYQTEASPSGQLPSKPINPLIAEKNALDEETIGPEDFSLPVRDFATQAQSGNTLSGNILSTADFLHAAPDPRSAEFLTGTSRRIANSIPFGMSIKLTGALFDQSTAATGQYFQMGQRSHRSRLELGFQTDAGVANSFQLCDGRFVFHLQTLGGKQQFEFVDLNRFSEQTAANVSFAPSNWIATGGLASLLGQFNQGFNFGAPKQITTADQTQLTIIRGCWNERALRHTLGNQAAIVFPDKPKIRSRNAIPWGSIPPQLPHGVEVVFGNDALLGEFPREIRYLKFVADPDGGAMRLKPMMTLQFSHPAETDQLTENMFVIRSRDIESVDTTDVYMAQVNSILAKRQAEKKSNEQQLK